MRPLRVYFRIYRSLLRAIHGLARNITYLCIQHRPAGSQVLEEWFTRQTQDVPFFQWLCTPLKQHPLAFRIILNKRFQPPEIFRSNSTGMFNLDSQGDIGTVYHKINLCF